MYIRMVCLVYSMLLIVYHTCRYWFANTSGSSNCIES